MEQTLSIIVSGEVQGVFFRQSTREKALSLGLKGSVKNNRDGSVQIIATGSAGHLEQLTHWARSGPPKAVVKHVDVKELPLQIFSGFSILR